MWSCNSDLYGTFPSVPHQQTERRKCTAQSYRELVEKISKSSTEATIALLS